MNAAVVSGCLTAAGTALALRSLWPHRARVPGSTPIGATRSRRRAARHTDPTVVADLLDALAADVRSGSSLSVAVERAAARPHDEHTAVALHTIGVAAALGGPVAATLRHGALVLRDRHAARAESLAHSAQARLSATVLTTLPVAFTLVALATSDSFRRAALSPVGLVAMTLGVALNLVGRWWMRRLVAGSTR